MHIERTFSDKSPMETDDTSPLMLLLLPSGGINVGTPPVADAEADIDDERGLVECECSGCSSWVPCDRGGPEAEGRF